MSVTVGEGPTSAGQGRGMGSLAGFGVAATNGVHGGNSLLVTAVFFGLLLEMF